MEQSIEAKHSIMVYEDNQNALAILYDKDEGEWGNPRPLAQNDIKNLLFEPSMPYPLPPEMLWYEENQCMIWYCEPCGTTARKIRIKDKVARYKHPGIVFKVKRAPTGGDRLSLAIVSNGYGEGFKRGSECNTYLYESPYRGIDVHGGTTEMGSCNVPTPKGEWAYCLDTAAHLTWESCFFESGFNYRPKPRNRLKKTNRTLLDWITNA